MIDSKRLKQFFQPTRRPAVVVASYGRSGSTMVYKAVGEAMSMARFGRLHSLVFDCSWTLSERPPRRGIVYKTHDYPQALNGMDHCRNLFIFGSPIDAVRSVIAQHDREGIEWVYEHFEHMKAHGSFEELLPRDVLRLEAQLDAWSSFTGSPVLCIRYDALWREQDRIQRFTQLPVEFPPQKPRKSVTLSDADEAALSSVYGRLDARVASLPDAFEPQELN